MSSDERFEILRWLAEHPEVHILQGPKEVQVKMTINGTEHVATAKTLPDAVTEAMALLRKHPPSP